MSVQQHFINPSIYQYRSCQKGTSPLATYNIVNKAYAYGAKNIKLSILSSIPP